MKTVDFTQHLLSIQTELFRFAFKVSSINSIYPLVSDSRTL